VEEHAKVAILLDFYGQLLTPRQYQILDLYYNSDYTLGEIASQLNISRQGVYDGVKKGKNTLKEFEDKLGHVKRFLKHEQALKKILSDLRRVKCAGKVRDGEIIDSCIEELEKVINDL
jgi:predicted DNA-binding protein YlxM (UPF0122 family)